MCAHCYLIRSDNQDVFPPLGPSLTGLNTPQTHRCRLYLPSHFSHKPSSLRPYTLRLYPNTPELFKALDRTWYFPSSRCYVSSLTSCYLARSSTFTNPVESRSVVPRTKI